MFYLRYLTLSSKNTVKELQLSSCQNVKNEKGKKNEENLNLLPKLALLSKYVLLALYICCSLWLEWSLPRFCPAGISSSFGSMQISWGWGGTFPMESYLTCPPRPQQFSLPSSWVCCHCVFANSKIRKYFAAYVLIVYVFLFLLRYKFVKARVLHILFTSLSLELRRISGKE